MDTFYHYQTIRKTIIQFLDIFNNLNIARYDENGTVNEYIKVPVKFGMKSKPYIWEEERTRIVRLPVMAFNLTGMEFAVQRHVGEKEQIFIAKNEDGTSKTVANPLPYNINLNCKIYSKFVSDMDQILEQILPYFSPNLYIKVKIDEIDYAFDVKVLLNGVTSENSEEIQENETRVLVWNLDFSVETYVFQIIKDGNIIKKIFIREYVTEDAWDNKDMSTEFTSGAFDENTHSFESLTVGTSGSYNDPDASLLYTYTSWYKE